MSDQDVFARILASLYQATLDDRHWPVTPYSDLDQAAADEDANRDEQAQAPDVPA